MLDLKPCPFCGNDGSGPVEDALHVHHNEPLERDERHTWTVQCDRCTATMGYSDSEDEAIEAWNCRIPAAARPAVTDAHRILGDQTVGVTLSAHPCTTSPVVDHETANVEGKPNAVTDALRELRGHIADVAAAGMLIGSNQNETFQRLQDKGKTMLAIVDTTLGAAGEPVAWQHRFRTGLNMDGEWGPWRYGRSKMHSIQSYYEERPLYAAPQRIVTGEPVAERALTADEQATFHEAIRKSGKLRQTIPAGLGAAGEPEASPEDKWKTAFAAQSRKLQAVLHIPGVRETLRELVVEVSPAVTDCPHCFGTGYYQGKMGQDTPPCPHCRTAAPAPLWRL